MNAVSVAVIGAGLAGLSCARRLREAGMHARLFEAQRAPGGRLATRRFATAACWPMHRARAPRNAGSPTGPAAAARGISGSAFPR